MYILPGALAPLAQYRQFILVQFVPRLDAAGFPIPNKTDKHPINPHTLMRHDAHDPVIWMGVAEASALAAQMGDGYGVGFVITASDPFICFDLDECVTLNGQWIPEVAEMMAQFPGAYEVSNSGRGLHGWAQYSGACPPHGTKSRGTLERKWLELYSQVRFMALGTGATGTMHDLTAHLPGFIERWFPRNAALDDAAGAGWTNGPCDGYTPLDDAELFTKARSRGRKQEAGAVFGGTAPLPCFADLYDRDVAVLSRAYPALTPGKDFDYSEADFALAKELAYWTGKDCERIARLMQDSPMRRDKWDTKVHRSYFHDTVTNAVAMCTQVHTVKALPVVAPQAGALSVTVMPFDSFLGRDGMLELFKDCAYIQDDNAAIIPNGDIVDGSRFRARYGGHVFTMDNRNEKTSRDAWEAFLNNSCVRFPRVDGLTFDPSIPFQGVVERSGRTWVNVYKKPVVDARPGDCAPFMTLLHKLLPRGDDALILLCYMAAVVQYPGVKFRWAPFIQGTRGNGKSTLITCLKHALGNKYIFSIKAGMIENNFNAWLERNILYVADDIYSTKDRTDMMEMLKALISEMDHAITYKGIDSIQKVIRGNFIFTDNHKDAMKKQEDSRGICTLYCAQQSKHDRLRDGLTKEYFTRHLYPWLNSGGFAHVAHMLATMEIDPRYNPAGECQEAPDTSMTVEAIVDGRTGLEHDVSEWIELEQPGFCGDFVSVHMLKLRMAEIPQYSKSASPLKLKEMLGRLGYEMHRGLVNGRVAYDVAPDNTRPILYVKRDTWSAELTDAATIAQIYVQEQQAAQTAAIAKRFQHGS